MSKYSGVKHKCCVLILFCQKHLRLSAQLHIRLETLTPFAIFTPQCIRTVTLSVLDDNSCCSFLDSVESLHYLSLNTISSVFL